MGVTSSLYVALSGMNMSQAGMEVASHNIANVNTPGYSRQRINLETLPSWHTSWGQMGTGVNAQNITRFHDEFLTRSIVTKSSQYGAAAAQKSAIDALESFFNESDGNGINAAMNQFFALWDSVADASELDPYREELVSVAQTLANQLSMRRADMDAIRDDINDRIDTAVKDINTITKSIAALNQEIMRSEDPSRNQQANDLRDTRDSLLTQLSELVDIEYWEDPSNGALNIKFAAGPALVMNASAYEVGAETDDSGDIRIIANNRRNEPPWPDDVTTRIEGGAVGGWLEFRDQKLRDFYLQYESFVDQLTFRVNNQHAQGVGQDLFTDITSSSNISSHPSYQFSFDGTDNDLKITSLVPHLESREPYSPYSDPENIAVRFVRSDRVTNDFSSSVVWNEKDPEGGKWEITITLPTDSNGNINCTAEDVIRYINNERSGSHSGTPTLPPQTSSGTYRVGDFISAQAANGNNWTGAINFSGKSVPSGKNEFATLDRTLANVLNQGHNLSYGSEYAGLTTTLKHTDNDLIFTAVNSGAAGEKIAIEYLNDGPNQELGLNIYTDIDGTKRISITLATDSEGKATTKASDILSLIKGDINASALVEVKTPPDQDGSGLVYQMDATYLDRSGSFEIVTYDNQFDPPEPSIYRMTVDPTDTLQDIVDRINGNYEGRTGTNDFDYGVKGIRAEVVTDLNGNSRLRLIADKENEIEYGFRNDTSGALAVLGINNIFTGDSSSNIAVNQLILENPRLLGAGRIDSDGTMAPAGNENALDMSDLKDQRFSYYRLSDATLGTAFNTFYADIGSTNRSITTEHDFLYGVLNEMYDKQDALAGVNLDEELADVLRFQYMYQASAKMVSTIDEMMSTLLAIR